MGTDAEPWAYDNERPAHEVDLPPFWIDTAPVTNGAYAEFIADGGYERRELWSRAGWAWREEAGLRAPAASGARDDGDWSRTALRPAGEPLRPTSPCSTCAGTRPTPSPAGRASGCRPRRSGRRRRPGTRARGKRRYPWGDEAPASEHANLGQRRFGPAPVGALPGGRQPRTAADQMIGDVWEWTSSDFAAVPGLRRVPVPRVLGGLLRRRVQGAPRRLVGDAPRRAAPRSATGTIPIRRQIFAGFRCARDA